MKNLKYFIFLLIIFSCKEKTFADDIVLNFDKTEKLTIQKFNEDANEEGSNLIYYGKYDSIIEVKYYLNLIAEPLPPPPKNAENKKVYNEYLLDVKKEKDSIRNQKEPYFRIEEIPYLSTTENISDNVNDENIAINVKHKDTIPYYRRLYDSAENKKHKAFPVFMKNISGKELKIPIEFNNIFLSVEKEKDFQIIRNNNYTIFNCLELPERSYIILKPNEIMIFALPFFKPGKKIRAKIQFYGASSKEFEISIDDKILKNQR